MPRLAVPHYAHVYEKPREGTAHVASYRADNYKHRIVAQGGYESASCTINVKPAEAEWIFSYLVGNVVRFHVDNPKEPIWEGYIERITYRVGGLVLTRSLENMANRVNVTYYNADSAAAQKTENIQTAMGTVIENTASQAIYGLKEMNLEAGVHFNNADKSHKNLLRQTMLAVRAWPQVSVANGTGEGAAVIELELRGLHYMAWDWQTYYMPRTDPDTLTSALWITFLRVVGETAYAGAQMVPANATSIYATGIIAGGADWWKYVTTNAAANLSYASESGQTYLQYILGLVEAGDGAQQYTFGIHPPDPISGLRHVHYNPANTAVAYQVYALQDTGRLRDTTGALVPGWLVKPDAGIQIMDVLIGYNQVGDDPRIGYIQSIEYDGETGLTSFQTGDNITMEGVLQKDRYYKAHGTKNRFGAQPRNVL